MSDAPAPPAPPASDDSPLPRRTTPTWEMELLISGVTVFALVQLGSALDGGYDWLSMRLRDASGTLAMLVYVYLRGAATILALTFVLHLGLRAAWVAIVGAKSVFPGGIDWSALRLGRVQGEHYRQRYASLDDVIERADNRASIAFALGVAVSLLLLFPIVLAIPCFFVTLLLGLIPALQGAKAIILALLLVLAVLPVFIAHAADKRFGERLRPGGLGERALRRLFRAYDAVGAGRFSSPILALLSSRLGERRVQLGMGAGATLLGMSLMLYLGVRSNSSMLGYTLVPSPSRGSAHVALPDHVAMSRRKDSVLPFIAADVVNGPYLRLTIPLIPSAHERALERLCGDEARPGDDDAALQATLACLTRLHPARIDGIPVAGLTYDLTLDPLTDLRALQAMIRVDGLAPGRHELQVDALPRLGRDGASSPRTPYRIPFWK